MRQLKLSVSALESYVTNHLQYHQADDVRMINSVSIHFDSLVSRLIHSTTDLMDNYHVTRRSALVMYGSLRCGVEDFEMSLATDLSKLLSDLRTASQIISLTA